MHNQRKLVTRGKGSLIQIQTHAELINSQISLQLLRRLDRQTSFHATVRLCVSERLIVPERTYVSTAALKPLERKDVFQSDSD